MARDIIDDRLLGSLHLRALSRSGLDHDPAVEHQAIQTGTIDALLEGMYDGDVTFDEILRLGDLGVGTVQQLDGELMILDGEAWVATADGSMRAVAGTERTPFVVVCRFVEDAAIDQGEPLDYVELRAALDRLAPDPADVVAFRVDGRFRDLLLRSVHGQKPPYPPLADVVAHQTEWTVSTAAGSLMGFRFPDASSGIEVPGYHVHFLSDDRTVGGHVLDVTLIAGRLAVSDCESLHVELPPGVELGTPGATTGTILALESQPD